MSSQTVGDLKQEIYDRIAEPRAKYIPGSNKQVDVLMSELRIIASQRAPGEPIPIERRERFSEIVTKLNKEYGVSIIDMATMVGINRKHISEYIKKGIGTALLYDEKRN